MVVILWAISSEVNRMDSKDLLLWCLEPEYVDTCFTDIIKVTDLKIGILSWIIWVGPIWLSEALKKQRTFQLESESDEAEGEVREVQGLRGLNLPLLAFQESGLYERGDHERWDTGQNCNRCMTAPINVEDLHSSNAEPKAFIKPTLYPSLCLIKLEVCFNGGNLLKQV